MTAIGAILAAVVFVLWIAAAFAVSSAFRVSLPLSLVLFGSIGAVAAASLRSKWRRH